MICVNLIPLKSEKEKQLELSRGGEDFSFAKEWLRLEERIQ